MADTVSYSLLVAVLGRPWPHSAVQALTTALNADHEVNRLEQLGFWECPERGLSLALKDDLYLASGGAKYAKDGPLTVVAVHLYSEGYEGYRLYRGDLVSGLSFRDDRDAVLRKLGVPAKSGGGNEAVGKVWPYWDRFDFADHALRVQYDSGLQRIDLITLMTLFERR